MKVHLIKKQSIEDYVLKNARSRASFEIWLFRLLIVQIFLEKVQTELYLILAEIITG